MHITMVKKITAEGSPCRKCAEVEQRLAEGGFAKLIDRIVIADEREPGGEGMQLAKKYRVELAPFFIVETDTGEIKIYPVYFHFLKEILQSGAREQQAAADILDADPALVDYI